MKSTSKKGNGSSSENKSNENSNGNENGDDEKEETVNFSLETIIRRGLNEQKLNTNFNNPFKFGKPDDNISLRVNPSANLFYEHTNSTYSDSSTDQESEDKSDMAEKSEDPDQMVDEEIDESIEIEENKIVVPMKRKPGRPKMSEEQKAAKRARNELLKAQNVNNNSQTMATPVDELMAMGHSLFSDCNQQQKKRGRKAKPRPDYTDYSTASDGQRENNVVSFSSTSNAPLYKKRGRKPKSYYLQLQQMQEQQNLNETAPAVLQLQDEENPDIDASSISLNDINESLSMFKTKRGRKPRAYYELLKQKEQLQNSGELDDSSMYMPLNASIDTANHMLIRAHEPKKKRGRRPKSYYLDLERQQQQFLASQANASIKVEPNVHNHSMNIVEQVTLPEQQRKRAEQPKKVMFSDASPMVSLVDRQTSNGRIF